VEKIGREVGGPAVAKNGLYAEGKEFPYFGGREDSAENKDRVICINWRRIKRILSLLRNRRGQKGKG